MCSIAVLAARSAGTGEMNKHPCHVGLWHSDCVSELSSTLVQAWSAHLIDFCQFRQPNSLAKWWRLAV